MCVSQSWYWGSPAACQLGMAALLATGNLTYEIGNPDLKAERANGFDVSLRGRTSRVRSELTVFYNRIDDFIFRSPLTDEEFEEREEEFDARFGVTHDEEGEGEEGHGGEFPFAEYQATDATLWGLEGHADVTLTSALGAEFTWDMVVRRPEYVVQALRQALQSRRAVG